MKERPNLAVQFINPAESGGHDAPVSQELPAKKQVLTTEQKQAIVTEAATGEYDDLVKVNKLGRLYNAAGNGNHSGKLVEMKRAEMIMAHADQIRDGLDEYAAAKELHEAGVADSDIELALANKRLNARADELEAAALARLDEKYPSTAVETASEEPVEIQEEASVEESASEVDRSAHDGESIDEYEARQGVPVEQRSVNAILDQIDQEEGVTPERPTIDSILDQIDREEAEVTAEGFGTGAEGGMSSAVEHARQSQEEPAPAPRTFRERVRDALTPAGFATEMGRFSSAAREKMTKRKKVGVVLGAVAVVGVAAWAVLNRDTHQGSGTFFTDTLNTLDIDGASDRVQEMADQASKQTADMQPAFSNEAFTVTSGEGWYQTFADMNIPVSERTELLDKIGPELVERGVAYQMGDSYGISEPGRLSEDVLQLIQDSRR